jgi:long-chain fatty acid transport protein
MRFGVGALALAQVVGDVEVATGSDGRVGALVEEQMVAAYAPVVGAALEAAEGTVLGAVWRGALHADFDMQVRVEDLGELALPELNISGVAQYDPMQVQAELGQRWDNWTVVVGATYQRWSAFHGWLHATVKCPSEEPACEALPPKHIESRA